MAKSIIKRVPVEKVSVIHVCTQQEQIKKLSLLLVGNGNPKDGYVYKVMEMTDQMKEMNDKLTGISGVVKELHEESIGKKAKGKTEEDIKAEVRAKRVIWIKTASFIIGALSLLLTAYFSFINTKKMDKTEMNITNEIRAQEGVSKVTRGGFVKYNDRGLSDSVKIK